uniref:Uncharacterized protein n=1 Tax=Panagrolaimus sp. ES5 TaxID=591445 RepID=A0AC34FLE0_9BILA
MTSEKQAYGFITANGQDNFNVYVVDSVTEKRVTVFQYHADEAEEFKAEIPKIEKFFKSFIIDLFELLLLSTPYQISYQFCEELKKDFEACEISSYFVSKENYHFSSLLIAANLDLKIDEKLDEKVYLILHHERHGDQPDNIFGITVGEYKFTPIGYQQISKKDLTALNSEEAPEILCQKICGTKKPKHVVTASFGDRENPLENVFDEKDLTLFQNCCFGCQFDKYIIETSKWIFDKTLIKNHVLPTSVKGIHVKGNYGTETNILDIMKVEVNDLLPIKKTAIVPRSIPELQVVLETEFCCELELHGGPSAKKGYTMAQLNKLLKNMTLHLQNNFGVKIIDTLFCDEDLQKADEIQDICFPKEGECNSLLVPFSGYFKRTSVSRHFTIGFFCTLTDRKCYYLDSLMGESSDRFDLFKKQLEITSTGSVPFTMVSRQECNDLINPQGSDDLCMIYAFKNAETIFLTGKPKKLNPFCIIEEEERVKKILKLIDSGDDFDWPETLQEPFLSNTQ